MKRMLLSMGLVMALLLTLTVPVGAVTDSPADNGAASVENDYDGFDASDDASASEEGTAEEAEIAAKSDPDAHVPDTMRIVFNPYRMKTVWRGEETNDAALSDVAFISSRDANSLRLNLSVSGVPAEKCQAVPVSSPDELGGERKQVFVWFEFQPFTEGEELVWNETYADADNQIAVNVEEGKTVILPPAQDGETVLLAMKAFAEFHIPSGVMWTKDDTIHFEVRCYFESLNDSVDNQESYHAEPSDEAAPVESADASDDFVTPANEAAPFVNDAEPVENDAQASDVDEPVEDEDAQASDVDEPVENEDAQASNDEEPVEDEDAQASDDEEPVEDDDAQASDDEEPVEDDDAQASDDAEPVEDEDAQASDDEEPVEDDDAQASDDEEPVEDDAQASDDEEPVEDDAQASDVKEPVEDEDALVNDAPAFDDDAQVVEEAFSEEEEPVEDEDAEPSDNEEPVEDDAQASDD